jgi:hypothetical protein
MNCGVHRRDSHITRFIYELRTKTRLCLRCSACELSKGLISHRDELLHGNLLLCHKAVCETSSRSLHDYTQWCWVVTKQNAGLAARLRGMRNACNICSENWREIQLWRPRLKWEDNIETDPKDVVCEDASWIHLIQVRFSDGFLEHGNDISGSTKGGKCLGFLSDD